MAASPSSGESIFARLKGDVMGGAVGAVITIPIVLSCGIVIFDGIDPDLVALGIASAFVSAVICSIVAGLFGGPTLHVNSPKTSHAAILAGLCTMLWGQPAFVAAFPGEKAAPALMTICFLTILISGAVQFGLGAARLGAVVKFVPHPVLAGFVNGLALQIIIGQIPGLFGVDTLADIWTGLVRLALSPWVLGIGVGTAVLTWAAGKVIKVIPAPLIGLAGGTLAWLVAARFVDPEKLGPVIGSLPPNLLPLPQFAPMASLIGSPGFLSLAFPILATGVTLSMISSIQSLLTISGADRLADTRHDSNAELMVQGGGNFLAALFGGGPSGGSSNVTQAVFDNGGRSRVANLAHAAALVVSILLLGKVIALIPVSAMAAVVITSTASGFDKWTRQLIGRAGQRKTARRLDVWFNLVVVIAVTLLVVFAGALVALGVGMSLAFMIFLYRTRLHAVHRVLRGTGMHSRTSRTRQMADALREQGGRIAVVELEGPLFFGSVDGMVRRIERELVTADWLVLDFRRVVHVDSSATMSLKSIDDMAKKRRKRVLFSYVTPGSDRLAEMKSVGFGSPEAEGRLFVDTDSALHSAESELLARLDLGVVGEEEVPLEQFETLRGLAPAEFAALGAGLTRHVYQAEEVIVRHGEPGRSVYLLARGQVSVRIGGEGAAAAHRLFRYTAGIVFGEMALLSGHTRAADVVADTDSVVYELPVEDFDRLTAQSPAIATTLIRNLAIEMTVRMRSQNETIRQLES
jgi:MFS superfamily sulfate permease-like transporter